MRGKQIELKVNHVRLEDLPPADQARIKYYRKLLRQDVGRLVAKMLERELAKDSKQKNDKSN